MDFQDVIRRRRMVRQFTADPVPQHSLDRIQANAVRGPSAGFCQGQAFLVLTGDDLPRFWALAGEATRPSVHAAPMIIVRLSCRPDLHRRIRPARPQLGRREPLSTSTANRHADAPGTQYKR
jgi:nitroreductase